MTDLHIPDHLPLSEILIQARPVSRSYATQILQAATVAIPTHSGKVVTLLDEGVDLRDPREVAWAVHTRVQPHRDVTTVAHTRPLLRDPSVAPQWSEDAEASKLPVDARLKWDYPPRSLPPAEMLARVRDNWSAYGLPPLV